MKLTDVLLENCIEVNAAFSNKQAVFERIAAIAAGTAQSGDLKAEDILEALLEREHMCTTGFGEGLAVPHCRLASLDHFIAGAITIPAGVEFNALDNKPVYLLFFLIGPEDGKSEHVHLLSAIAQLCKDKEKKEALFKADSPNSLLSLIGDKFSVKSDFASQAQKELMTVFVHTDEEIYIQLLEVFASIDDASVSIVNTQRCSGSLMNEPIFLGLMEACQDRNGWIIFAIINKSMTNEIVRRIENVTGPLGRDHDILVTVQNLIYSKGSLNL
jgi:PTS system nitrogen regulatory IIA component